MSRRRRPSPPSRPRPEPATPVRKAATATLAPGQTWDRFAVLGYSGLNRYGGWVQEELLPELQGDRWLRVCREMADQDPTVGSLMFAVRMLSRRVDWRVEPPTDDPADQEVAEFLESCLHDMSAGWEDTLSEILSMLIFGWSYFEIVYKVRGGRSDDPTRNSRFSDGRIGWRKLAARAQETRWQWEFDEEGGLQGMWQMGPPSWQPVFLPIDKCLLFRTEVRKGNPEGVSILRNAYRPWYFKRMFENIEGIGVERDLAGLPIGRVPAEILSESADPDQVALRQQLQRIVTQVKRDEAEGILWPSDRDDKGNLLFDLQLLSAPGDRQFDVGAIIERKKQEIAGVVLADFLLMGHTQHGSFALVDTRRSLFATALEAWLDVIAEVITQHGFCRLLDLNGMDVEEVPQLKHSEVTQFDLEAVGGYIKNLADSGAPIWPNGDLLRFLLESANLPTPPEEADLEPMQPTPPAPPAPPGPPEAAPIVSAPSSAG